MKFNLIDMKYLGDRAAGLSIKIDLNLSETKVITEILTKDPTISRRLGISLFGDKMTIAPPMGAGDISHLLKSLAVLQTAISALDNNMGDELRDLCNNLKQFEEKHRLTLGQSGHTKDYKAETKIKLDSFNAQFKSNLETETPFQKPKSYGP